MALLHILHRLAADLALSLSVAHLNHGIRGEAADRDQDFAYRAATTLTLPFYTRTVDVPSQAQQTGTGLEEAARQARHAFLHEIALSCGAGSIAVGHHKGDMAEQLLLNLLRGSGLKGLGAMDPVTRQGVIRPLLDCSRKELTTWLEAEGIDHVTDATNSDTAYTRNRVRHVLIPMLEASFNPSAVDTLARTAALMREEEAWVSDMATKHYCDCLVSEHPNHLILSTEDLSHLHPAARRRVLRRAAETLCGSTRTLTTAHIQNLTDLMDQGGSGRSVDLSRGLRGILTKEGLHLTVEDQNLRDKRPDLLAETPPFSYHLERPTPGVPCSQVIAETGDHLTFQWRQAPENPVDSRNATRVFLSPEAASFPLTIRNTRPGDRFRPEGGSGGRKLGRFLSDCNIEGPKRSQIPLVVSKEKILWVAGHRLDTSAAPPSPGGLALEIVLQRNKKG
ncbi:tRNA(Ile)-lysidine synthase [Desulfoluna limicola]|uniref:tRNA(Ile)-lysidine synthase n=2 Tax=Desulfoluna limicola TaxID=2810562 RepID=A0ABM7PN77_9BACT|nr:tRNA(Ile)-lysidine synthase [Desulfoluna limicola]